jgi:hypothetical protein
VEGEMMGLDSDAVKVETTTLTVRRSLCEEEKALNKSWVK